MTLSLMVAMDRNGIIGRNNQLPWHLSADLKHFKATTMGKPIIMGRKTHESIGRALPGRTNIVLSTTAKDLAPGCKVVASVEEARLAVAGTEEAVVIGGAAVYASFLPEVDRLYVTHVDAEVIGDVTFPPVDWADWQESDRVNHAADGRNDYPFSIVTYQRKSK
jgi:dihydrofolate reductase